MVLLKAEHITKKYSGRTIIKDINIELHKGELISLLGVSGSGKTTLFHVLSGLTTPEEGRVLLNGEDITSRPGQISYMLQKDLLFPHKKIIDNTALPLVLHGMSKKEARKKAQTYFENFGLEGTEYQYPSQLSGGMRQRAALLRTYLSSNGVALLDEPFSALDTITKTAIHRWYLEVMQHIDLSHMILMRQSFFQTEFIFSMESLEKFEMRLSLKKRNHGRRIFTSQMNSLHINGK